MTTTDQEIVIAEAEVIAPLTTTEQQDLARCEQTIERGLHTYIEVGEALMLIRDERLYRQTHRDFDSYVRARWPQFSGRRQVDRLISAAEVAENLRPIGLIPSNESQARVLASLPPDQQRLAMQAATKQAVDGTPTAKQIQQAVDQVRPPTPKPSAPARPAPPAAPAPKPTAPSTLPPSLPGLDAAPVPTPAPTPSVPPPLPGLSPVQAVKQAVDQELRKLLVAKYHLLEQTIHLIVDELARTSTDKTPTITIQKDAAREAARSFVNSPALGGAAAMLAFSAVVGEVEVAEESPPLFARIEALEAAGSAADVEALAQARRDLDAMVEELHDRTYQAMANRLSAVEARIRGASV